MRNMLTKVIILSTLVLAVTCTLAARPSSISWLEKNNRINHESVCYNHDLDSRGFRKCRSAAKKLFKEKCNSNTKKIKRAKKEEDKIRYTKLKEKFCHSAETYTNEADQG